MSKRFDAATKALLEAGPEAWLALAGVTVEDPLSPLDTDVSTITSAVDGVFKVHGPSPWVAHFEFQSTADPALGHRLLRYNLLLDHRHDLPVLSIAVLLRPSADGPASRGVYERRLPSGTVCHVFHYAVVRVWELPATRLLEGGLATLPLAPIADIGTRSPAAVAEDVGRRLQRDTDLDVARELWAATILLAGLRFGADELTAFVSGGPFMHELFKDSWVYQEIARMARDDGMAEGRTEGETTGRIREARAILSKLGRKRFGAPDETTRARIESITEVERLEAMIERADEVASWQDLLQADAPEAVTE